MRHRTLVRRADALGVFPQSAGGKVCFARAPVSLRVARTSGSTIEVNRAGIGINANCVAIFNQRNGPALGSASEANMPDAEATRGTGKAPVSDERHLVAISLTINRRCRRQHFAHARAALRPS